MEFDALVEAEFKAEDNLIKLDDLNDIKFIDSGQRELLLDSLISDAIDTFIKVSFTPRTYKEVLNSIKKQVNDKRLILLPQLRFKYLLI